MHSRAALIVLFAVGNAFAGEPVVRNISVRGLQIGGVTTLAIDGDELGKAPRLLLPFPAKQKLDPKSTASQASFEVALDDAVVPGYYHLRVMTEQGVSLPVVIGVDRLPQKVLAASVESLPVALHGSVAGSAVVETKFTGKAGQKIMIEVEAQRLGSKLRPIAHLYGPKRLQVAWSWTQPTLGGDTRLEATLPDSGPYAVTLHDAEYAATAPSFYRLRIGQWSYADQVFPPAVSRGSSATVELVGSAAKVAVKSKNDPFQLIDWPKGATWSGPRPFVAVSALKEIVGDTSAAKIQELPLEPVGVSGRLASPFAEDRYRLAVKPGTKLRLEVFAERLGSPLDVALVLRGEAGNDLIRLDDRPGTLDPLLDFVVPDKMKSLTIAVVDVQGRGGPRGIYRLTVEPSSAKGDAADIQLTTLTQRLALPQGGSAVLPVRVERQGYHGSINIVAKNLPPGVKLDGTQIPEGADGTLITVSRGDQTGEAVISAWHGRTQDGREETITLRGHPLERLQPWLATEIAVAPTEAKAADFQIDWRDLPSGVAWVPASKLTLPVKLSRSAATLPVRLSLLTTQPPAFLANNQPDPNGNLKLDKAVELGAKIDQADLVVVVPPGLNGPVYDVTVLAELLSADKKTVTAVAYAPVRRLEVKAPIVLALTGGTRLEGTLDPKAGVSFKITGTLDRPTGLTTDATLALTGLPGGIKADAPVVKANAKDFTVNVVLPPTIGVGEIRGLKLSASAPADGKQPNVRVRSRDLELTLVIKAPTK